MFLDHCLLFISSYGFHLLYVYLVDTNSKK